MIQTDIFDLIISLKLIWEKLEIAVDVVLILFLSIFRKSLNGEPFFVKVSFFFNKRTVEIFFHLCVTYGEYTFPS